MSTPPGRGVDAERRLAATGLVSRRGVLKGAAVAAAAALWAAPSVESVLTRAAASEPVAARARRDPAGVGQGPGPDPVRPLTPTVVTDSGLGYPLGVALGDAGVYVADFGSVDGSARGRILLVDLVSAAVTVVLDSSGYWPSDVDVDSTGNVYFTDYGWDGDDGGDQPSEGGALRVLHPTSGAATTAATLAGGLIDPSYLLVDEARGVVYVSDTGEADGSGDADPSGRVWAYPLTGTPASPTVGAPRLVAGTGKPVYQDGGLPTQPVPAGTPVSEVVIFVAFGLAAHGSALYVADEYAHVVYRVELADQTISTFAGDGQASNLDGTGDGGPATSASVPYPQGLAVDPYGNLYILQIEGQIRRVDARSGVITTVSDGPYVGNNAGVAYDPAGGALYYVANDYPQSGALYRVG